MAIIHDLPNEELISLSILYFCTFRNLIFIIIPIISNDTIHIQILKHTSTKPTLKTLSPNICYTITFSVQLNTILLPLPYTDLTGEVLSTIYILYV